MRKRIFCVLACAAALGGCGSPDLAPPPQAPRQATVFDPMLQQKDRAQQQATEMERRKQQLDADLEAQER